MASLEEQIADLQNQAALLLDLPQQMQTAALGHIDDIADSYQDHIDRLRLTFYVSATGDDSNSGLDADNPLQTIERAVLLTPVGGVCNISVMSDIHIAADVSVYGKAINIRSNDSVKYSLSFEHYTVISNNTDFSRLRSFAISNGGIISVRDLTITLPDSDNNLANNQYSSNSAVFKCSTSDVAQGALTPVSVIDCNILRPANSQVTVIGLPTSSGVMSLSVRAVVETGEPLAGFWVNNVAANATPASTGRILSNLATL